MIKSFVVSSNIQQIGWKNNTLFIQFNSGDVYSYKAVAFEIYKEMEVAESVGNYFHRNIRSKFDYTKLNCNPFEPHFPVQGLIPTLFKDSFQPAAQH